MKLFGANVRPSPSLVWPVQARCWETLSSDSGPLADSLAELAAKAYPNNTASSPSCIFALAHVCVHQQASVHLSSHLGSQLSSSHRDNRSVGRLCKAVARILPSMTAEEETKESKPGVVDMKVTTKKPPIFYVRSAKSFFTGMAWEHLGGWVAGLSTGDGPQGSGRCASTSEGVRPKMCRIRPRKAWNRRSTGGTGSSGAGPVSGPQAQPCHCDSCR